MSYTLTGFEGKVALVTGAGRMRSIGRPVALALAKAGCDIVLTGTGRHPERYPDDEKKVAWRDIDSVADEIRQIGRRALPIVSDISNPRSIDSLLKQTISEFGRIDFLINNAGAPRY